MSLPRRTACTIIPIPASKAKRLSATDPATLGAQFVALCQRYGLDPASVLAALEASAKEQAAPAAPAAPVVAKRKATGLSKSELAECARAGAKPSDYLRVKLARMSKKGTR